MDTLSQLLCSSPQSYTKQLLVTDVFGSPLDTTQTMSAHEADYDALLGNIAEVRNEIMELRSSKLTMNQLQELGTPEVQQESFFILATLQHAHHTLGAFDNVSMESYDGQYTEELLAKAIVAGGKRLVELGARLAMHMLSKGKLLQQAVGAVVAGAVFDQVIELGTGAAFAFVLGDKEDKSKTDDNKQAGVYMLSPKSLKCVLEEDGEKITLTPTSNGLYAAIKKYNDNVPKILKELGSSTPKRDGLVVSLGDLRKLNNTFQWRSIKDSSKQKLDIKPKDWLEEVSRGAENIMKLQKQVEKLSNNPEKPALDIAKSSYDALHALCTDCTTWLKLVAD